MDPDWMRKMAQYKMPFGKYKGKLLIDIPEEYFIWMKTKGIPEGSLGEAMSAIYEIKLNGLEHLFDQYR